MDVLLFSHGLNIAPLPSVPLPEEDLPIRLSTQTEAGREMVGTSSRKRRMVDLTLPKVRQVLEWEVGLGTSR